MTLPKIDCLILHQACSWRVDWAAQEDSILTSWFRLAVRGRNGAANGALGEKASPTGEPATTPAAVPACVEDLAERRSHNVRGGDLYKSLREASRLFAFGQIETPSEWPLMPLRGD